MRYSGPQGVVEALILKLSGYFGKHSKYIYSFYRTGVSLLRSHLQTRRDAQKLTETTLPTVKLQNAPQNASTPARHLQALSKTSVLPRFVSASAERRVFTDGSRSSNA